MARPMGSGQVRSADAVAPAGSGEAALLPRFSRGGPDRQVAPLGTGEHGRTLAGASQYVIDLSAAPAFRGSSILAVFRATPS
jgi:hypothetical protein